jgi:hypothetical protein
MNVLRGTHIVVEGARHTVSSSYSHLRRAAIATRHARRRTVHRLIQVKHRTAASSVYLLRGREDLLWVRTKGGGQRALDPLVEIVTQEGVSEHSSRGGRLLLLLRLIEVR